MEISRDIIGYTGKELHFRACSTCANSIPTRQDGQNGYISCDAVITSTEDEEGFIHCDCWESARNYGWDY